MTEFEDGIDVWCIREKLESKIMSVLAFIIGRIRLSFTKLRMIGK